MIYIRFIFISILCYQTLCASEIGLVTKVVDGDTIYLLNNDNQKVKIRLQYIDAPELDQFFGNESKLILERLILNKKIILKGFKKDKYNRLLGVVSYGAIDINLEMIKSGAAWHFKKYAKFDQMQDQFIIYDENEKIAKLNKIGLWEKEPIPPWQWRKNKK
jgi:micrococcal nuclease